MQTNDSLKVHPPHLRPTSRWKPRNTTQKPTVVVAEDDDDIRTALHDVLEADGYLVNSFSDGELVIEHLGACQKSGKMPDLIITDHRMPGYSGMEILEGLQIAGWATPVIVITAFGEEIRDFANALGAQAVFDKPFDLDDLRTAVIFSVASNAHVHA